MIKNAVYFIVITFLVAEIAEKILFYVTSQVIRFVLTQNLE